MTAEAPEPGSGKAWKQAAVRSPMGKMTGRVIAIAVVAAIGAVVWLSWSTFSGLDVKTVEVETIAAATVERIAAHWDSTELLAVATPALARSLEAGAPLAERYRILGNLLSVGKCTTYSLNVTNGVGDAQVRCDAAFAAASTTIALGMSESGGQWQVYDIAVML